MRLYDQPTERLISGSVLSALNIVVSSVAIFILYRMLLNTLGSESIGLWSVTLASCSVARVTDLGLGASAVKFVAKYAARQERQQITKVIETAMLSIGIGVMVVALALFPLLKMLLRYLLDSRYNFDAAVILLPYALFSMWLGLLANFLQSSLDGLNRVDLRVYTSLGGTVLFLVSAWVLVRRYGLVGLALSQIMQAFFLWGSSWVLLRGQGVKIPLIPVHWSRSSFLEMLSYGATYQLTSIAILVTEPMTKGLMTKFGGLSATAYFEMASQMIQKLRLVLVSANQALVPAVALAHEANSERVMELYVLSYRYMLLISLPYFALMAACMTYASDLWVGSYNWDFVLFGWLLVVGWGLNTIGVPAYFVNVGTGGLKWNAIGHIVIGALNVLLGIMFGAQFGGMGVVLGFVIALVVGSWVTLIRFHRDSQLSLTQLLPKESVPVVMATTIALVVCMIFSAVVFPSASQSLGRLESPYVQMLGLCVTALIFAVIVGPVVLRLRYEQFTTNDS